MKKIILTLVAIQSISLGFNSCSRSDDDSKLVTSFKNVETIMSDSRLVSYINNNDDLINR